MFYHLIFIKEKFSFTNSPNELEFEETREF